tara:strand:- start:39 stop:536 length:498 start_codon:yes stop_codon:yes gene_type:complete
MSYINGEPAEDWIEENRPENGLFKVYWKDRKGNFAGRTFPNSATLDENESEGLRYEWYYKNGKHADGMSRAWYPNGQLKCEFTWKDGKQNGLAITWNENGYEYIKGIFKDGEKHGIWTIKQYFKNGQIEQEEIFRDDDIRVKWTMWDENGQKRREIIYKDGKRDK